MKTSSETRPLIKSFKIKILSHKFVARQERCMCWQVRWKEMVERDVRSAGIWDHATFALQCGLDHFTRAVYFRGMRWPACRVGKLVPRSFSRFELQDYDPWSIDHLLTEYCIFRAVFAGALARQFFKRSRKVMAIGKPYSNRHLFHAVAVGGQ